MYCNKWVRDITMNFCLKNYKNEIIRCYQNCESLRKDLKLSCTKNTYYCALIFCIYVILKFELKPKFALLVPTLWRTLGAELPSVMFDHFSVHISASKKVLRHLEFATQAPLDIFYFCVKIFKVIPFSNIAVNSLNKHHSTAINL